MTGARPGHVSRPYLAEPFVQPVRPVDPDPHHERCDNVWNRAERLGSAFAIAVFIGFALVYGPALVGVVLSLGGQLLDALHLVGR